MHCAFVSQLSSCHHVPLMTHANTAHVCNAVPAQLSEVQTWIRCSEDVFTQSSTISCQKNASNVLWWLLQLPITVLSKIAGYNDKEDVPRFRLVCTSCRDACPARHFQHTAIIHCVGSWKARVVKLKQMCPDIRVQIRISGPPPPEQLLQQLLEHPLVDEAHLGVQENPDCTASQMQHLLAFYHEQISNSNGRLQLQIDLDLSTYAYDTL